MKDEPNEITLQVITVLEQLGIRYLISGSFASTVHGTPRATLDVDLLADVKPEHIEKLYEELHHDFYISEEAIHDALKRRTSFNLIHLKTLFKVDVFLPKGRSFDEQLFKHRAPYVIANEPERTAYVASPEDIILIKLEWYRLGNEVSERQWQDLIGIFKVQAERLNLDYLKQTAAQLGVRDLLDRLMER